jgi:hypothetical protein
MNSEDPENRVDQHHYQEWQRSRHPDLAAADAHPIEYPDEHEEWIDSPEREELTQGIEAAKAIQSNIDFLQDSLYPPSDENVVEQDPKLNAKARHEAERMLSEARNAGASRDHVLYYLEDRRTGAEAYVGNWQERHYQQKPHGPCIGQLRRIHLVKLTEEVLRETWPE